MAHNSEKGSLYCWTDHQTAELIRIWGDETVQSLLNNSRNNSIIFQLISDTLKERGIERSAEQCRSKIKYLKKEYMKKRKALASSEECEVSNRPCKFFLQFDEILEKRPSATPPLLNDSLEPEDLIRNLSGSDLPLPQKQEYSVVEALVDDIDQTYESTVKDATTPAKKKRQNASVGGKRKRVAENRRISHVLNDITESLIAFEKDRDQRMNAFLREERELAEKAQREILEREEQIMHLLLSPLQDS